MHSRWKRFWLQIKGDRSIRQFLFQQTRVHTLFDEHVDDLIIIVTNLLYQKDAFHVKIHWSSNQLTIWNYCDPYNYHVFVGEEIFKPDFLDQFADGENYHLSKLSRIEVFNLLETFAKLRFQDPNIYLRSSSIHLLNGLIGMTFSCDGTHYIDYAHFDEVVKKMFELKLCDG